jgi:hypothetical protein
MLVCACLKGSVQLLMLHLRCSQFLTQRIEAPAAHNLLCCFNASMALSLVVTVPTVNMAVVALWTDDTTNMLGYLQQRHL